MNTNDHPKEEDGVNFTRYALFLVYEVSLYANVHLCVIWRWPKIQIFDLCDNFLTLVCVFLVGLTVYKCVNGELNVGRQRGKFALLSNIDQ